MPTEEEEAKLQRKAAKRAAKEAVAEVDDEEARLQRKAAKRAAKQAAEAEASQELDEAEAKRLRKEAKKAARQVVAEAEDIDDEEEEKKRKKAARKAAKQAVVEAEEAEEAEEADEEEAKKRRKAAKKAAKRAAVEADVAEEDPDEDEAKRQRRAAKKAARLAEAEAAVDGGGSATSQNKAGKTKELVVADEPLAEVANSKPADEAIKDSAKKFKVFVKGLPYTMTEDAFRKDFEECGEISNLQFPMEGGKPKGFAFIEFAKQEGYDAALKYDHTNYGGRFINVSAANDSGKGKAKGEKGKGKGKDGDWVCPNPECGDVVFARNSACRKCGTANPNGGKGCGESDCVNQVFIRGLPFSVDEEKLRKDFAECGEIASSKFPLNEEGRPRGIAFIKFATPEGVDAALKLDDTDYSGRTINVCKSEKREGKDGKGKGKDGKAKGKDGKGKGKKGKAPSASFANRTGCIVEGAGEKKTFADSDDE